MKLMICWKVLSFNDLLVNARCWKKNSPGGFLHKAQAKLTSTGINIMASTVIVQKNGDAEIRLYDEMNLQIGVVRFLNNKSPLPNDVYENNIIYLYTNITTLDAILHKLENSSQKLIHFDSTIPVATLKFD